METPGPLRILYSFPGSLGKSGIGWTAWNQVHELVQAGHTVHLVAASVARPVPGLASLTTTLTVAGQRVPHRVLGQLRSYAWHDWRVARALQSLALDVVHIWPGSGIRTITAARALGLPVVRECPNTHTGHAYEVVARESEALGLTPPKGASHTADPRRLAIEQREWDAVTGLLVPSPAVATSFLDRGYSERRLLRHRYGCTPGKPNPVRQSRPFTALFLGRCEPRKGLHYALRAWRNSTAAQGGRFLIYGQFEPAYRELLAADLAQPGVEVRGFTSDPLQTLADSDVLLLPSIEEGSALVTYEAQTVGCVPLVSTAAGALLDHDVHGLVHDPGDVATLTEQLNSLADDADRLAGLRAAALAHAPELSWAKASDKLVAAYRRAIELAKEDAHADRG